jgi:hypothetical protein
MFTRITRLIPVSLTIGRNLTRNFSLVVLCVAVSATVFARPPTGPLLTFASEQQAQQHCPTDTIVWVNLPTGIYHYKGQRWYGNTNSGAYVCKAEADQAGDRGSRNGQ